jgi:serine/threonine-protein kinase
MTPPRRVSAKTLAPGRYNRRSSSVEGQALPVPGTLIEGKYEILAKIREGGMGAVYKVRHRLLDETRVIKVMRPQIGDDEDMKKRFVQEAKTVTKLKHPNIGTVIDFALDSDGTAYIVMEFIDGVTLADILKTAGLPQIPLALEIAHQTLLALGYLHRHNLVHRDVAPDNLMLTRDEDGRPRVKVIDLGIAKALDKTVEITSTGVFLGKVKYCSPEQLGGLAKGEILDGRSDIYSLGIVLYELLTGQRPLRGQTPRELFAAHLFTPPIPFAETDPQRRVPEPLRAAVLKAIEKKREDRFASADEFDREILRLKAQQGEVDRGDSTMRMIMTARATPIAPVDSVTPSAQDRLDRQFRTHWTPTPMKTDGLATLPPFAGNQDATVSASAPGRSAVAAQPPAPGTSASTEPIAAPRPSKSKAPLFIGAALVVLAAAGYLVLSRKGPPPAPQPTPIPQETAAVSAPTAAPAASAPAEDRKTEPTASAPSPDDEAKRFEGPAADARRRAARSRASAERARAAELARATFDQARARERDAQRLYDGSNFAAAQVAFDLAAQLFQSAQSAAVTAANAAPKTKPPSETLAQVLAPTVTRPEPVHPTAVPTAEPPRPPSPTAVPVRPVPSDQERISETLRAYEKAQSTLDVNLYGRVYVGLTPERRQQVSQAWQDLKSQDVRIECQPATISATTAEVSCFERRVFVPRVGTEQRNDSRRTLRLEKRGDAWFITSMK